MARTNRINFKLFSFLFALERNYNKNFLQVWEVAGHGVVTLPLPAVWGWFLSGKNADLPKERSSRKIREWGTKCSSTLLCLPGFGNTGLRLWQLSKVELEYVHSQTNSFSFFFFRPELQEHSTGGSQKLLHFLETENIQAHPLAE